MVSVISGFIAQTVILYTECSSTLTNNCLSGCAYGIAALYYSGANLGSKCQLQDFTIMN